MFTWGLRTQSRFRGAETAQDWNDWTEMPLQVLHPPSLYDLRTAIEILPTSVFSYLKSGKGFYFTGESVRIKIKWFMVDATWYRINVRKCGFTHFCVSVGAADKQRSSEISSQGKTQGLGESKGGGLWSGQSHRKGRGETGSRTFVMPTTMCQGLVWVSEEAGWILLRDMRI